MVEFKQHTGNKMNGLLRLNNILHAQKGRCWRIYDSCKSNTNKNISLQLLQ